jgi:hypothetical protein
MTPTSSIRHAVAAAIALGVLALPATAQQRPQVPRSGGATRNAPLSPATPAQRSPGLNELGDDALISELASRGLESLLDRAFDVNQVPPDRRAGVRAFGALRELTDKKKPPSPERRQALINQVVAGSKTVLPTVKDPSKLMEYASLLITEGAMREVNLLNFWGDNPATQARLRPTVETVIAMLEKAAEEAEAQKAVVEKRMVNPNDRAAADQWMKLEEASATAKYTRAMAAYYLAISLPTGPAGQAQRAKIADEAIAFLKEYDNADYNLQPVVRNRTAKLQMAKGDFATAKETFATVIAGKGLTPPPDLDQQYEARYFSAVCDLEAGKLDEARKGLADLLKWQKENLANREDVQKGVSAAADMLQYRIHMAAPTPTARPAAPSRPKKARPPPSRCS